MKTSENNKRRKHFSIAVSVVIGCVLFIVSLSVVSAFVSYRVSKNTLYARYQAQMTSIIDTVDANVDHDDMYNCVKTQTKSEKYNEAQKVFDNFAEDYSDLHYIYILELVDDPRGAISIISGNTKEEYEAGEGVFLGDGEEGWYTEGALKQLHKAFDKDGDSFFFEDSSLWGKDYTLARPVKNSEGIKYGLLCVDISSEKIDSAVQNIVLKSLFFNVGFGLLAATIIIVWMYFFVIRPVRGLRKSVTEYADSSHNADNPEDLVFTAPKLLASKEILDLSDSVEKMSNNMKNYVTNILEKEEQVQTLSTIALQDALTGVKNKAAYDKYVDVLNQSISKGEDIEFAIVMLDVNDLKSINDHYGHDSGDIYIKGVSNFVCNVYKHSPVYRIGGDEIVVILQGEDYKIRDELIEKIKKVFVDISHNTKDEKYMRYSAAIGMSVFIEEIDTEVYSVFRRADKQMYANKAEMKK